MIIVPFTSPQRAELELQALIYKCIFHGYPIPEDLLLPIRKSVAALTCLPYNISGGLNPITIKDLPPSQALDPGEFICNLCKFVAKSKAGLGKHRDSKKCKTQQQKFKSQSAPLTTLDEEPLCSKLQYFRLNTTIIHRIPKAARLSTAEALSKVVDQCVSNNNQSSWNRLLTFAYTSFCLPEKSSNKKQSLTTIVKNNLTRTEALLRKRPVGKKLSDQTNESLKRAVEKKLMDGDVSGAVRVLSSEDTVAPITIDVLNILRSKHPVDFPGAVYPEEPDQPMIVSDVTIEEVFAAIKSFPNGSASGIDGLRPQHLKDILGSLRDESSNKLCASLAALVTLILHGRVPSEICPVLYGATLTALRKKDKGIRPIAVGNPLRRIARKVASKRVMVLMGNLLCSVQLGYGTRGGAEATVHATRAVISGEHDSCSIMLKLDFQNTFNSIRRDKMLEKVQSTLPDYYKFIWQMYRRPSHLFFDEHLLLSESSVQQGDPLGPLLFCLCIRKLTEKLKSPLNVWYLDDGTLAGKAPTVADDLRVIQEDGARFGLQLNLSKCELFAYGGCVADQRAAVEAILKLSPSIGLPERAELSLLGSPLLDESMAPAIQAKITQAKVMTSRLKILSTHQALFLLKNCLSMPKLLYVLRSSPAWRCKVELENFDAVIRSSLSTVSNTELTDNMWIQASLPVKYGGIGFRRTEELALPAYLASVHSVHKLISVVFPTAVLDDLISEPTTLWSQLDSIDLPLVDRRHVQQEWDHPLAKFQYQHLWEEADQTNKARLLAVSSKESGCWLNALPVPNIGNLLDDDSLRISVALRLGATICQPHFCRCGKSVDVTGHHGLSCKYSVGRHSRHGAINEVLRRALATSGVQAILEPPGVDRGDGKRPDGMTLVPWSQGKALVWDVTCVDTLAQSYVAGTSCESGKAADLAEKKKVVKYQALQGRYFFSPLGFETFGSWGPAAKELITDVGEKLIQQSGEGRSLEFLRQKISIEIQ